MAKLLSAMLRSAFLFLLICATPAIGHADIFRVELPDLERVFQMGESLTVPVDLGTALTDLTSIQVEISGVHSNGWWVGDRVEHFDWDGPKGNYISAYMNYVPVDFYPIWTDSYYAEFDGQFTITLTLARIGGGSDWSFLTDGVTDLCLNSEGGYGWGTFTTTPVFDLTNVTVVIDAVPVPEPSSLVLLSLAGLGSMVFVNRYRQRSHR